MKISGPSSVAFLAPFAVNSPVGSNKILDLKSHA
jgi:hypothetical protein